MRRIRILAAALLLVILAAVPAFANSARTRWGGTDASGAVVKGEDCPVVVEKELLTFDIGQFPQSHYFDEAEFQAYDASVTAEYTFYNPSDCRVEATLLFPFGPLPDYGVAGNDTEKYRITLDGSPVESTLRHTFWIWGAQFDLENDLGKLHDGYMEDSFYYPDQLVTKYTYQAADMDLESYDAVSASITVNCEESQTRVLFPGANGGQTLEEGGVQLISRIEPNETMDVYVIGEPLDLMLQWKFHANGAWDEEIPGTINLVGREDMSLNDFVMSEYDEKHGVAEHDWYNAAVEQLNCAYWQDGVISAFDFEASFNMSHQLMRWYEYDISLEPDQRIVNTVTAPIYPDIDGDCEPPIYEYTYLLSPAATWADFGTLDIVINTPFYMLENSGESFTWNNPGYELHLSDLPEGELTFVLCSEAKSNAPGIGGMPPKLLFYAAIFLMSIITSAIYVRRKEKKECQE